MQDLPVLLKTIILTLSTMKRGHSWYTALLLSVASIAPEPGVAAFRASSLLSPWEHCFDPLRSRSRRNAFRHSTVQVQRYRLLEGLEIAGWSSNDIEELIVSGIQDSDDIDVLFLGSLDPDSAGDHGELSLRGDSNEPLLLAAWRPRGCFRETRQKRFSLQPDFRRRASVSGAPFRLFASTANGVDSEVAYLDDDLPLPTASDTSLLIKPPPGTFSSKIGPLIQLTRPSNYPGIVLFHLIGVYLAIQSYALSSMGGQLDLPSVSLLTRTLYGQTLSQRGSLWMVLLSIVLTSSTSMVVNDYYDAKLGRDDASNKSHALAVGLVSYRLVKAFLMCQYAMALLLVPFLPGALTRLSVIIGLILTYLYTSYLKPITWLKNIVCALLIALSPLTSGAATLHLLQDPGMATIGLVRQVQLLVPLLRLTAVLFAGVLGREILMDCNDVERDRIARIQTVPVVYGRRFASRVALGCSFIMSGLAIAGPVAQAIQLLRESSMAMSVTSVIRILTAAGNGGRTVLRRLGLVVVGSALVLRRYWRVAATEASDKAIVDKAVEESLITVLFFLFSFL
jgi:4-hydroxybenzoate polyprenyltransferase